MENKINVLIEKPATINFAQLKDLYSVAKKYDSKFLVMFHWVYGSEIVYLHNHMDKFIKKYGKIQEIRAEVNDPYCNDTKNKIIPEKIGLEGTWLDCGISCISMIESILPMVTKEPTSVESIMDCCCSLPYYTSHKILVNGDTTIIINVDWREKRNFKRTYIKFANGALMFVNHTDQMIYISETDQEKEAIGEISNFLFYYHDNIHAFKPADFPTPLNPICDFNNLTTVDRLHTHYYNLFTQRDIDVIDCQGVASPNTKIISIDDFYKQSNSMKESLELHRLLFDINPSLSSVLSKSLDNFVGD